MSALSRAFTAELAHLREDRWDLAGLTLLPVVLLLLMAAMLIHGVPRQLPVAVVDDDHSALSRAMLRHVASSPIVEVAYNDDQLGAAFRQVRMEQAWAVLHIPRGMEDGVTRHTTPAIHIFYQGSFLSMGSLVSRSIEDAVTQSLIVSEQQLLSSHGLPAVALNPPTVQATVLENPSTSFEWYLTALIDPAVLHLLVACMTVVALGREAEDGSLGVWAARSDGVIGALVGKMLPYVVLVAFWGAVWLIWISWLRGWPVRGSLILLVIAQTLLFAGTAGISALLVALTRNVATGLSASAIYAGSALAYSGATLPLEGANGFAQVWSRILPLPHYIELQMGQYLGSPVRTASADLGILALYTIIGGGSAALLLARAARQAA